MPGSNPLTGGSARPAWLLSTSDDPSRLAARSAYARGHERSSGLNSSVVARGLPVRLLRDVEEPIEDTLAQLVRQLGAVRESTREA
jgi:hypothetical protein